MKPWELKNEERVYDGYRKINRRTFKIHTGDDVDFDVEDTMDGAAAIFALTPQNLVVIFRTFRPGPNRFLHELPGGGIEGEDPQVAVERELLEETGYRCERVEPLGEYWRGAYNTGTWKMFLGRNAMRVAEPEHELEEWGEVVLLPIEEFKEKLFAGELTDTTCGYAALHRLGEL